jgi:hypothetical protein
MRRFVVTNHRFTDEFREKIVGVLFGSDDTLLLECEEMTLGDTPVKESFLVTIDNISNDFGYFYCLGHINDDVFRLEEEQGTLYLSIT